MIAWRGPLAVENTETGDGRVIAAGAVEWDEGQHPLAYKITGDQHVDTIAEAPQVGTIDRMWRDGDLIMGEGQIDDGNPDGAELIRRLEAGTASHGHRQGVSIDPDNWALEVWATDTGEDELMLTASGCGELPVLTAAAGDPDSTEGKTLIVEDDSGATVQRMTRLRVRGVTAVAVPAFSGAFIELAVASGDDVDEPATDDDEPSDGEPEVDEVRADASLIELSDAAPPKEWFVASEPELGSDDYVEQPDGGLAVPLTITDDGRVFGHAARWGQCHIGYPNTCVTAPSSPSGYQHFHRGETRTADGFAVATGPLTMDTDHAAAALRAPAAIDHYAHTGLAWADVRLSDQEHGIWMAGALRPDVTPDQVSALRKGGVSGDWRTIPHGSGPLEMISLLAVNTPGFQIVRAPVAVTASAHIENGVQTSLTSAGMVFRCADCERDHLDLEALVDMVGRIESRTKAIELRTRHLIGPAAAHVMGRIRS